MVLSDGIRIERDEGPTGLSITEEKVVTGGNKGKSKIDCDETWQNQAQVCE